MKDLDARVLAFEFMCATDQRANEIYRLCRRLLGHRERRRDYHAVWSDAFELLAVLIADSETFAAGVRRRLAVVERRSESGLDQERRRA